MHKKLRDLPVSDFWWPPFGDAKQQSTKIWRQSLVDRMLEGRGGRGRACGRTKSHCLGCQMDLCKKILNINTWWH